MTHSQRFSKNIGLESIQAGSHVEINHFQGLVSLIVRVVRNHLYRNSGWVPQTTNVFSSVKYLCLTITYMYMNSAYRDVSVDPII